MRRRGAFVLRWALPVVSVVAVGLLAVAPGRAVASNGLDVVAAVNGQALAHSTQSHPVPLSPGRPATVALQVSNTTAQPLRVQTVELQGTVAGLTFYSFDTSVNLQVGAHQRANLRYALDLTGLDGQATGLIPGSLVLLDANHRTVASEPMVSDVAGSIVSVYGLFGLGLLVLTALVFLSLLLALARHTLPANRFRRGLRFAFPGIGLGLILVFTTSATRVWLPSNARWLVVLVVCAAIGFAVGFLTPTPLEREEEEQDEDEEEDLHAPQGLSTTAHAAAWSPSTGGFQ